MRPMPWRLWNDDRLRFAGLMLMLALIMGWIPGRERLDLLIHDLLLQMGSALPVDHTVIIAIDEKSLAALGRWPWPRDVHARLIDQVAEQTRAPLVFDVILAETGEPIMDDRLADSMRRHGNVWLPLHLQALDGHLLELLPAPAILAAARGIGHVHIPLDPDGLARRVYLHEGSAESRWPALSLAVARASGSLAPLVDDGTPRGIPFAGPPGSVPTLSFIDVLNGQIPTRLLAGKTLFVGATAAGLGDFLATPWSARLTPMAGVEIHANLYEGLRQQRLIQPLPSWQASLPLVALILLATLLFPRLPPQVNWPLTVILALATLALSGLLLQLGHLWFAPAQATLTLLLAYPLWSWRRFRSLHLFLNSEIQRLGQEPALRDMIPNHTVHQWAQQIVLLLAPDRWAIQPATTPPPSTETVEITDRVFRFALPGRGDLVLDMHFAGHRAGLEAVAGYLERLSIDLGNSPRPGEQRRQELVEQRITQIRQAIESMQDLRRFVSEILARLPTGILIGDELGRLIYANAGAQQWLRQATPTGAMLSDLLGRLPGSMPPERWLETIRQAILLGENHLREWHEGDTATLISIAPLRLSTEGNAGVIVVFTDITPVHVAQQERLETIHFISHDLRAPLTAQLVLLEKAAGNAGDPATGALLRSLLGLTRKSLSLADGFLQLARVEAQSEIRRYPCNLADLVDNALDTLSALAAQVEVVCAFSDADAAADWFVLGNADLLERAVANLVSNAIKFSPRGGQVRIRAQRLTEGPGSPDVVRLSVEDQGPGIDPDELPGLFDSFRRTRASEQQRKPGSGLGLRFVKTVAQRHEGRVGVSSAPGHGSRFWIDLPLAPPDD